MVHCKKLKFLTLNQIKWLKEFFLCYRNENNQQTTDFHSVFVYNRDLVEYVQNNLTKLDRVLVTGKIGHQTKTLEDGKKKYSGFIVADNIHKIARRKTEAVSEPVKTQSAASE